MNPFTAEVASARASDHGGAEGRGQSLPLCIHARTVWQGAEIGGVSLMSEPRDINRDAKWRRLARNEGPSGDIGANHAAWRC